MSLLHHHSIIKGVGGYSADAQDVFDKMTGELPTVYKDAIAAMVDSSVVRGNWDDIEVLVIHIINTEANSLICWKGFQDALAVNGISWSTNGFLSDNTLTQYISTQYDWASAVLPGRDDFNFISFLNDRIALTGNRRLFGMESGTKRFQLLQSSIGYRRYNHDADLNTYDDGNDQFQDNTNYGLKSTGATSDIFMIDGVDVNTQVEAGRVLATGQDIYTHSLDNDGVSAFHLVCSTLGYVISRNMTDQAGFNTDIETLKTALVGI